MRRALALTLASFACSSPEPACPVIDGGPPTVDAGPPDAPLDVAGLSDVAEPGDAMACPPRKASGTTSRGFQIDVGHTGGQPGDEIVLPLCRRWSVPVSGYPSAAAVEHGRVFVATRVGGQGGGVYAFAEDTGQKLWGPVSVEVESTSGFAEDDDTVFTTDLSGNVAALAGDTGATLWNVKLYNGINVPPTASNGRVYVTSAVIRALDEKSGAVLWTQTPVAYGGAPSLANGLLFETMGIGRAEAFDPATGNPVWSTPLTSNGSCAPPAAVATTSRLYSFDDCSGAGVTFAPSSGARIGVFTSSRMPALGDTFAVFTQGAEVLAVDLASGTIRWRFDVSGTIEIPPIVVGHHVAVADYHGILYVIDADTGKLASSDATGKILQAGALSEADGMLFLSGNGTLIAY